MAAQLRGGARGVYLLCSGQAAAGALPAEIYNITAGRGKQWKPG